MKEDIVVIDSNKSPVIASVAASQSIEAKGATGASNISADNQQYPSLDQEEVHQLSVSLD